MDYIWSRDGWLACNASQHTNPARAELKGDLSPPKGALEPSHDTAWVGGWAAQKKNTPVEGSTVLKVLDSKRSDCSAEVRV